MASPARKELNQWLKQIHVEADKVLDIGGLTNQASAEVGSIKSNEYKILDIRYTDRHGKLADYVLDLNTECSKMDFDVAFCIEVMPFVWDPVTVMKNISGFLKPNGILYITFHQIFIHVKSNDYLRYTRMGVEKLMEVSNLKIDNIEPRLYRNGEIRDGEVGHFVKAIKI